MVIWTHLNYQNEDTEFQITQICKLLEKLWALSVTYKLSDMSPQFEFAVNTCVCKILIIY